jgi:hypothetical protein
VKVSAAAPAKMLAPLRKAVVAAAPTAPAPTPPAEIDEDEVPEIEEARV